MKMISRLSDAELAQLTQQARQRVIDREADLHAAVLLHESLLTRQAMRCVLHLGLHEGDVCKLDGKEVRFEGVHTCSFDGVGGVSHGPQRRRLERRNPLASPRRVEAVDARTENEEQANREEGPAESVVRPVRPTLLIHILTDAPSPEP